MNNNVKFLFNSKLKKVATKCNTGKTAKGLQPPGLVVCVKLMCTRSYNLIGLKALVYI